MRKILGRLFWLFIILVMGLWTFEFYRVRNGKDPLLCFKVEEHIYEDGITKMYVGFGYKVFNYNRTDLEGREFVFLFAPERTNEGTTRLDIQKEVEVIEEEVEVATGSSEEVSE